MSDADRRRARGSRAADLLGVPVQTGLTALAIFAAATALVVTLALRQGLDDPFAQAQDATRGAHVGVSRGTLDDAAVARITRRPGVVASDVRPEAFGTTTLADGAADVRLQGLPAADTASTSRT